MVSKGIRERFIEKWFGVRLAEEALKVGDLADLMQINKDAVKAHNKTLLDNYENGEMGGIHIGDIVTNEGKSSLPSRGTGKGLLTTLVLGALTGGGALGFFGPSLVGSLSGGPVEGPDLDTKYILGLGAPDEPETKNEIPEGKREDSGR